MLNTGDILDGALGRQHDGSDELRSKALGWLNDAIQLLAVERRWSFLQKSASLTVSGGAATLPTDFDELVFLRTDAWYLLPRHQLVPEEVETNLTGDTLPVGFTLASGTITFYPTAPDGTASLTYLATVPNYADSTETILPEMFGPLLSRAVLNAVYEYEADARAIPSIQINQAQLDKLKAKDQKARPIPQRSGYLRGRL